jgi:dihydroneopterin aldolase
MKNIIKISGINIRANHGCLEEETLIGGDYTVDIEINTDYSKSFMSDKLNDTVDYCQVYEIVKDEMSINSKLIEHVANRIILRIKAEVKNNIEGIVVRIIKHNPPMNGQVNNVSVEIHD